MLTLDVVTLTLSGLLAGNEFAIAAWVHPALSRLPDSAHFPAGKALAQLLGRVMPFWYALILVLTAGLAVLDHRSTGTWPWLIVGSAGVLLLTIVFTIAFLVPINNRVAAWTDEINLADWKVLRSKWDQLHRWRVVLLTTAFVLLATGLLRR